MVILKELPVLELPSLFLGSLLLFFLGFYNKVIWIFVLRREFSFVDLDDDPSQIRLETLSDFAKKVMHPFVVRLQVFGGIMIEIVVWVTSPHNQVCYLWQMKSYDTP